MIHSRQHIANLPAILKFKGVENVVISPGSRNAPLIQAFYDVFGASCISIVDERSAAYFALGLALISEKPSVIISTSGTAGLNYAPAIAEAFHQGVPLIAITADRPAEWIDQQDNQTIRQTGIYAPNCKAGFLLPLECNVEEDLWYSDRLINEAYHVCTKEKQGPVHINVPLREPLYTDLPKPNLNKIIEFYSPDSCTIPEALKDVWLKSSKILIICGQSSVDSKLNNLLNQHADDKRIVVLAEAISNCSGDKIIGQHDLILASFADKEDLTTDLVVYFGGSVVSKRLKTFLRQQSTAQFWLISPSGEPVDTFMHLTNVLEASPISVFEALLKLNQPESISTFSEKWQNALQLTLKKIQINCEDAVFSDLVVFSKLTKLITSKDIVFLGNSSIIRYMFMFPFEFHSAFSNRGTSGIDGCLSTSAGIATGTDRVVFSILGDMSFLYDSNGLWNRNLPSNLKIIVVNNEGGSIFELIDGPSGDSPVMNYLKAHHPVDIKKLSGAYGIDYMQCNNSSELEPSFDWLKNTSTTSILEIKTPADKNPLIFRNFISKIKIDYESKA